MNNIPTEIKIIVDGEEIVGHYFVESKMVTVESELGSTSTQLGGTPAPILAKRLLREHAPKIIKNRNENT